MKGPRLPDSVYTDPGATQIRSCVDGDRYPEPRSFQGRNSLPVVSFSRTQYRISLCRFFARGAYRQEGPTGQRGLLASGGCFGPGGLPLGYAPVCTPLCRLRGMLDDLISEPTRAVGAMVTAGTVILIDLPRMAR